MLVLTMKPTDDEVYIGDNVKILLLSSGPHGIRIGIEAPKEVNILRKKVWDRLNAGNPPKAAGEGLGRAKKD